MTFLWIQLLWLLLAAPALVALYWYAWRRKRKRALRFANLAVVKEALERGPGIRRHIPPHLLLMALTLLIIASARPQAILTLSSQRANVVLAIDISGSMRGDDVDPNRITAAQEAVRSFVKDQPKDVRIGIVTFGINAMPAQRPTSDREEILKAIEHFELQEGTNIGDGILISLKELFPDGDFDLSPHDQGVPLGAAQISSQSPAKEFVPVPPGSNSNAVIILLSDGQATVGPDPTDAARKAAERGVRVYTVGLGSRDRNFVHYGGRTVRIMLNEEELKGIADLTHGSYYRASTAAELKEIYKSLNTIYESLNTQAVTETTVTEITALFSAAGSALALLAIGLSLLWFNRIL